MGAQDERGVRIAPADKRLAVEVRARDERRLRGHELESVEEILGCVCAGEGTFVADGLLRGEVAEEMGFGLVATLAAGGGLRRVRRIGEPAALHTLKPAPHQI